MALDLIILLKILIEIIACEENESSWIYIQRERGNTTSTV